MIEETLDSVLEEHAVLGVALVGRDGVPVLSRFTPPFDQKALNILAGSAMVATLSGAAEEAVRELDGGPVQRTIVEARNLRLLVTSVSERLLLVVISDAGSPLDEFDGALTPAIQKMVDQLAWNVPFEEAL